MMPHFNDQEIEFLLPPDTYYIGDPCYAFPNTGPFKNAWSQMLDKSDMDQYYFVGQCEGFPVYANSTAYGDGCYKSNVREKFSVDSGLLGILSMSLVERLNESNQEIISHLKNLGKIKKFKTDCLVKFYNDGTSQFGNVIIQTN